MNRSGAGRYVRSLYFALSTTSSMGYGNGPAAVQDVEYVFAVCVQLFGACISAVIFSNISSVINKGDAASMRFFELTDRVNEFIRFHHLFFFAKEPAKNCRIRASRWRSPYHFTKTTSSQMPRR